MAFFSDGSNEYFSLNLHPAESDQSYVFALNKQQKYIAQHFIHHLLHFSIFIFTAVTSLAVAENFDLSRRFLSESDQILLLVVLAGVTTVIGFSELALFLWVRGSQHSLLSKKGRSVLKGISILKARSWMTYLIMLVSLTVPFVSLMALPGGVSALIADSTSSVGISFVTFQLGIIFLALGAFLIKRIVTLLTIKDVTCA
jgi:hypothetical protein